MKICLVCSEYPPALHGGIGVVNQVLARALVQRGHEVRVIGIYAEEGYAEDAGVRVWRLRSARGRFGWIADRRALYRTIAQWSRAGEIDLVEVSDWGGAAAFWPQLPVPVVARVHGSATYYAAEMNQPVPWMTGLLERRSMRRADFWCSVSQYAAAQTQKIFGLRAGAHAVLYNPVTLPADVQHVLPAGRRVVFTGTLTPKKGVVSLIKAWPAVRAACPDAELHLLGKDGRTDAGDSMQSFLQLQLDASTAPSVVLHGHVGREAVLKQLRESRVAVFPSYSEAFALAPIEAMGCGCPTIYSRRSSGPELIRDGQDGLLIDPDRPQEIAQAIVRVLTDDKLAAALSAGGAHRVRERFSLETLVKENEEFYNCCIGRGVQRLPGWRTGTASASAFPDCCLVVPTYRRPAAIVKLLDRLVALPDLPAEMVIVDGSPDTQTHDAVMAWVKGRALPFDLRVVQSPAGLTRQRNVGIDASTKDLVFFLDDDCLPEPGYFRAMREVFVIDTAGRVGAVAGSPINEMEQPLMWRWRVRFLLGLAPRAGEPGRYYPMASSVPRSLMPRFNGTRPTDILPGATFACRRAAFATQRFSMFFDGYSQGEDLEMSLRLGRDWQILWSGDARCIHEHTAAGRPDSYRKGRMEVRNRYFIWKRHTPQPGLANRLRVWLDFGYLFALDLAGFVVHPWAGGSLQHAAGVASGALSCWLSPPRYDEPPARREFEVAWE
jgi:glycosyltransferase involved in cell wall biosynthesis/GT2 family glycosyltransferase